MVGAALLRPWLVAVRLFVGIAFSVCSPTSVFAANDVIGVFQSGADENGIKQTWNVSGDPTFWKIKITFFGKDGKELGSGHAATATRNGKVDELSFVVVWDQKPGDTWPDYPHCLMVLDKENRDKAKFGYEFRRKKLLDGELQRVKP
jgi:hypothetical protein